MISSLTVTFCREYLASEVFVMLLSSGWGFPDQKITYEYFKPPGYAGQNVFSTIEAEWTSIQRLLDFQMNQGDTVGLDLLHPQTGTIGSFSLTGGAQQKIVGTQLEAVFFGSQPRLQTCLPFTDFSSLMAIMLEPFIRAEFCIFEVQCTDSND